MSAIDTSGGTTAPATRAFAISPGDDVDPVWVEVKSVGIR